MALSPSTRNVFLSDKTEIKKVFDRFDSNQDGKISGEELAALLKSLGSSTSAEEVELMISEMDSDKDGVVTLEEFAQFCSKKLEGDETGSRELHDAFEMYDKDDNGLISASELQQVQTGLGEACSVQDCSKMIKGVDVDGDANVSFEEFRNMMTNDAPKP